MKKKELEEVIDKKKINELVSLSKKFVNVAYILLIVLGIYAITILLKEWKLLSFFRTLISIISPLFIGLVVAWLFDPIVTYFTKKNLSRKLSTFIVYLLFLIIIGIILGMIFPLLSDQLTDFAKTIPQIIDSIKNWISDIFSNLKNIEGFDAEGVKNNLFANIEGYAGDLTSSLPTIIVNLVSALFSGLGVVVVGLIIGFYILISFDNFGDALEFLPENIKEDTQNVIEVVNKCLRRFVEGALIDSTLVFIVSALCLWMVGLKAPLLFGLFCGITNVIPYAGPYIGGAPAVIVGFSQGMTTGLLTLLVIAIIQFIEGNFFQPVIMSKTTKLHPVTIMLGLLVFGYFWGIIGMVISTPIIAALKALFIYFENKYNFLNFD